MPAISPDPFAQNTEARGRASSGGVAERKLLSPPTRFKGAGFLAEATEDAEIQFPELPIPADIPDEALAHLSDHGSRPIWAEGSPVGRLMVVLDNPGSREDVAGNPFMCGTRQTLQRALKEADMPVGDVYVTYLLKRRPRKAYDRQQAWQAYLPLLEQQVDGQNSHVVVCMGNTVVHALFGLEQDVKGMRGQPVVYRGIPAIITYHPLAARRRPALYPILVKDLSEAAHVVTQPPLG